MSSHHGQQTTFACNNCHYALPLSLPKPISRHVPLKQQLSCMWPLGGLTRCHDIRNPVSQAPFYAGQYKSRTVQSHLPHKVFYNRKSSQFPPEKQAPPCTDWKSWWHNFIVWVLSSLIAHNAKGITTKIIENFSMLM